MLEASAPRHAPHEPELGMTKLEATFHLIEMMDRQLGGGANATEVKAAIGRARAETEDGADILRLASRELGYRLGFQPGSLQDAIDHAAEGAPILIRGRNEKIALVLERSALAARAFIATGAIDEELIALDISPANLAEELDLESAEDLVAWTFIQEDSPINAKAITAKGKATSLRYLLRLVAKERKDLKIVVVFAVAIGLLNLATPITVEALVNTVAFGGLLLPVIILALMLMACLGLAAMLSVLQSYVVELLQRRLFVRLTTELSFRIPHVSIEAFDRHHGPELVNRFFDILVVQKTGAKFLLDVLTVLLSAGLGLLILAFYHPILLAFDLVLISALLFVVFFLGRGGVQSSLEESTSKYAVASWLEELARHAGVFKHADGLFAQDRADSLARDYLANRSAHYRVVLRQIIGSLSIQVLASTALLGLGGWLVELGELTLGQLVASWLIVSVIVGAITKLGFQLEGWYDLLTAAKKVGVLLDLPLESREGCALPRTAEGIAVEARNITLGYPNQHKVITDLSLSLAPGERIALRGRSGSGKSTLLEAIAGLRPPASGLITLDGYDLRELRPSSIQGQVAYTTSQQIIEGTVMENIRIGRQGLSTANALDALRAVELLDDIRAFPEGLDTPITTEGLSLSTGQAQRLILARAMAGRPRLLLVDGVLDNLDQDRRDRIVDRLCSPERPWTLVIASHNEDILGRCQRVIELGPKKGG